MSGIAPRHVPDGDGIVRHVELLDGDLFRLVPIDVGREAAAGRIRKGMADKVRIPAVQCIGLEDECDAEKVGIVLDHARDDPAEIVTALGLRCCKCLGGGREVPSQGRRMGDIGVNGIGIFAQQAFGGRFGFHPAGS